MIIGGAGSGGSRGGHGSPGGHDGGRGGSVGGHGLPGGHDGGGGGMYGCGGAGFTGVAITVAALSTVSIMADTNSMAMYLFCICLFYLLCQFAGNFSTPKCASDVLRFYD